MSSWRILTILASFLALSSSQKLLALDVAWEGYFRARGNFQYNLDMNRDQSPNTRNFTDMRFRLNPTFFVSDKVRIKSSLSFFDGVLGDQPWRRTSYNNPALANNRLIDRNQTEAPGAGAGGTTAPANTNTQLGMGGAVAPDGFVTSTDLSPIYLRRVWGEFDFPFGTIKVGRMPYHFGLGVYANAGDDPQQQVGTTRDRIVWDTDFGNYYMRPGIGWMVEGALDQAGDDFMEYFFVLGRKSENQEVAMNLAYNGQNRSGSEAGTSFQDLKTTYWLFDFYLQNRFDPVNLSAEVVLVSGKAAGKDLLAINTVGRAEFDFNSRWDWMLEAGYGSGTSESDLSSNEVRTLQFNRDYDVALIVFEEALPGGRSLRNTSGTADNLPTAPHSGAVSNVIYGRTKISFDAASFFQPALNIIVPFAAKQPNEAGGRWYGVEYDFLTNWPFAKYWSANFAFGHFIPQSFYDDVSSSHSVIVVRTGLTATF